MQSTPNVSTANIFPLQIVALVFYQGFVFTILEKYHVIKATEFWFVWKSSDQEHLLTLYFWTLGLRQMLARD